MPFLVDAASPGSSPDGLTGSFLIGSFFGAGASSIARIDPDHALTQERFQRFREYKKLTGSSLFKADDTMIGTAGILIERHDSIRLNRRLQRLVFGGVDQQQMNVRFPASLNNLCKADGAHAEDTVLSQGNRFPTTMPPIVR